MEYAREELVAELGTAFLCGSWSLQGELNHTEYLNNWISLLRNDENALMRASTKAKKAADFIMDKWRKEKGEKNDNNELDDQE